MPKCTNESIERQVLRLLADGEWGTATYVSNVLGVRLQSVGGLLHRMWKAGKLRRESGHGPRGGYGYAIPRTLEGVPSWHERLLADESNDNPV